MDRRGGTSPKLQRELRNTHRMIAIYSPQMKSLTWGRVVLVLVQGRWALNFSDLCLQPNTLESELESDDRGVGKGDLNSFNLIEHSNPASMIFMANIK